MDIGSIFLILALLFLVVLFILRPLLERENIPGITTGGESDHQLSVLLAERDQILNALVELDLDYALGKIPVEDYPQERAKWLEKGTQVLKSLDKLDGIANGEGNPVGSPSLVEMSQGNQLVQTTLSEKGLSSVNSANSSLNGARTIIHSPDDDLESMLANRRRIRQEKAAGFCPSCGHAVQKTDKFCPKCGYKIG